MSRPAVAVFLALVAATFGAFVVAQRLKGAAPVVELVKAQRGFSPDGDGVRDVKRFGISVRTTDELTVDVVDRDGNEVRRLADDLRVTPQRPGRLRWDGRGDGGRVVRDGFYQVRVSMRRSGRSVIVPTRLRVDTRPPRPYVREVRPRPLLAPGTSPVVVRAVRVSRKAPTQVTVWRTDLDVPRAVAHGTIRPGLHRWRWDRRVASGRPAPPGTYLFQVAVTDRAGNVGRTPAKVQPGTATALGSPGLTIRALGVQPPSGPVTAGARATAFVASLHRPYRWWLRRVGREKPIAKGRASGPRLTFRAPAGDSGLYLLRVASQGTHLRAPILVQSRERARVLVVVPMLTWIGRARTDQDSDGMPDTLDHGGPVAWPRVLDRLPAGLEDEVAPLLVFLDRAGVRYDLTSDLALMRDRTAPRATDRAGVLLAGAERWVTPSYAKRLRRYVADGGRLATIGVESLRRSVTVVDRGGDGRLARPTQPIDRDPFGARLRSLRTLRTPTTLLPIAGGADAPLLAYWDGTLTGFGTVEESEPPEAGAGVRLLAGVGVEPAAAADDAAPPPPRPALTQAQLGKGTVIRIGLPGWARRLGDDPDVAQLTRNAFDLLAGRKPKPRDLRSPRG